jgi:hypothetical protein
VPFSCTASILVAKTVHSLHKPSLMVWMTLYPSGSWLLARYSAIASVISPFSNGAGSRFVIPLPPAMIPLLPGLPPWLCPPPCFAAGWRNISWNQVTGKFFSYIYSRQDKRAIPNQLSLGSFADQRLRVNYHCGFDHRSYIIHGFRRWCPPISGVGWWWCWLRRCSSHQSRQIGATKEDVFHESDRSLCCATCSQEFRTSF